MTETTTPTMTMQVAIDCADPHAQVRFWAAAFDYQIEDHHDLVVRMLDAGYATAQDTVEIDGRMAWKDAAACRRGDGSMPRLLFQVVPEPKTIKDRIHLDVHVSPELLEPLKAKVLELGATHLWDGQQGPQRWSTFADPEGNEFCLS